MMYRKTPERGGSSANRATPPVERGLDAGRDRDLPPTPLRKLGHNPQERRGGSPSREFLLDGSKFRHHLVVHRDLNARSRISLDPSDQGRQPFTRFADREFHHCLRERKKNVQRCTKSVNQQVVSHSADRRHQPAFVALIRPRPDNPLNPANKHSPGVPCAPVEEGMSGRGSKR